MYDYFHVERFNVAHVTSMCASDTSVLLQNLFFGTKTIAIPNL